MVSLTTAEKIMTNTFHPYATKFTREGVRNMQNRKPFRSKAQKKRARDKASIRNDGAWRSNAEVSFHPLGRKS
jgi:hypothetical protein